MSVTKSVIIADIPENEQLSGVVSAWSSLPSNIRMAIVLLVQPAPQTSNKTSKIIAIVLIAMLILARFIRTATMLITSTVCIPSIFF